MEADVDDTLPGRTPAIDAYAKALGLDLVDVDDTVVAVPATDPDPGESDAAALAETTPADNALADTAPIDPGNVSPGNTASFGFRIGASGAPTAIDSVIYIGRRPATPRITGGTLPTLVTVSSPQQLVSSTHLEVRQEGSAVVVTDLRSTNGTIVTAPGRDPRTLLQGESLVVTPGAVIDIGDDVIVEIVALGRLRAPVSRA